MLVITNRVGQKIKEDIIITVEVEHKMKELLSGPLGKKQGAYLCKHVAISKDCCPQRISPLIYQTWNCWTNLDCFLKGTD